MLVIFGASTSAGTPQNTSRIIGPILNFLHVPKHLHDPIHYGVRKTAHFVEYTVLGFLMWRALRAEGAGPPRQFFLALALCALYAASDEFHQSFVKGREASVRDVLIDSSGAAFGLALFRSLKLRRKN